MVRSLCVEKGTEAIEDAFENYYESHTNFTQQALSRWENQDWRGVQEASRKRPRLYGRLWIPARSDLLLSFPLSELGDPAF